MFEIDKVKLFDFILDEYFIKWLKTEGYCFPAANANAIIFGRANPEYSAFGSGLGKSLHHNRQEMG